MATKPEDIGRIGAQDPRVQSGQLSEADVQLIRVMAERRQADPFTAEDMPGAPRGMERLVAEFGRGLEGGLTMGVSDRSKDQSLDTNPGKLDWTDVAAGLGYLTGSTPYVLAAGGVANLAARAAAPRLLSASPRAAQALGKIAQYLATPVDEGAGFIAKTLHGGGREVYEGLAYSLAAEGAERFFDDDMVSAREIATNIGVGAGLDFLLGATLGRYGKTGGDVVVESGRDILTQLRNRLSRSDIDLDRELAEEITARLARAGQVRRRAPELSEGEEALTNAIANMRGAGQVRRTAPEPSEEALDRADFLARRQQTPDPMSSRVVGARRAERMAEGEPGMGPGRIEPGARGPLARPVETIEERIARLSAEPEPATPRIIVPGEAMRSRERAPVGVNREGVDQGAALAAQAEADPMSQLGAALRRSDPAARLEARTATMEPEGPVGAPLYRPAPTAADVAIRRGDALVDEGRRAVSTAERMAPRADVGQPATAPRTPTLLDAFGRPIGPQGAPPAPSDIAPPAPRAPEARMAAPEEPASRMAAPEPEPDDLAAVAPRVQGQEARQIAADLARAVSIGDVATAAANIPLVRNASDQDALAAFAQERINALGGIQPRPNVPRADAAPARGEGQPARPEGASKRSRTAQRLRSARQQRDEARRAAEMDELTGTGNRRAFERARGRAEADENTELAVVDLDNFKAVNDNRGLEAGDAMLRRASDALKRATKEVTGAERVFRYGGDEFTVIAPKGQAERVLARAREIFGSEDVEGFAVALRGGVGDTFEAANRAADAVKRADLEAGGARYRNVVSEDATATRPTDSEPAPPRTDAAESPVTPESRPGDAGGRAQSARTMERGMEGRPTDGEPINPGDRFRTVSGHETTPYPKGKDRTGLLHDRWLAENALAEAERRGDEFNARQFRQMAEGLAPSRKAERMELSQSDRDALNMYLWDEQPEVVRSALRPLSPSRGTGPEAPARPGDAEADLARRAAAEEARRQEVVPVTERVAGVDGKETTIITGAGSEFPARYRVVELDDLVASHNPSTFQKNPRYPEGVQERPYHAEPDTQKRIQSEDLDPRLVLDPTSSSNMGPPQVTPSGVALGGNERTMRLAVAYEGGRADAYRDDLLRRAADFGVDEAAIRSMRRPVLVREVSPDALQGASRDRLRQIGEDLNVDPQKGKSLSAEAATRAARMQRGGKALRHLTSTLDGDETVRSYLGTANGRRFLELLVEDGVVPKQEVAEWIDPVTRNATGEARDVIEQMVLTAALRDSESVLRAQVEAKESLNKLTHAVPAILKADRVEGFNVSVVLREALDLASEARANKMDIARLVDQGTLFNPRDDNPFAVTMARFIEANSGRKIATAMREFAKAAEDAQAGLASDLFGEPVNFRTAFERIFGAVDDAADEVATAARQADEAVEQGVREVVDEALDAAGEGEGFFKNRPGRVLVPGARDLETARTEVMEMAVRAAKSAVSGGRDTRRIMDRWFMRATSWVEKIGGEHGKRLAEGIRAIDQRASKRAKNDALDIAKELRGLTRAGRETIAKIINGHYGGEQADALITNAPKDYVERANRIRAILDRSMNEAANLGMTRDVGGRRLRVAGSGKAYPQVPNEKGRQMLEDAARQGLAHPRVAAVAEAMVRRGQAIDAQDALERMLKYRDGSLRGVNGYFERSRFELPEDMIEWDPNHTLPSLLERNWMTVESVREWGVNLEQADRLIGQIEAASDAGNGRIIREFIGHHTGKGRFATGADSRTAGAISNYQTLVRLGFSMLSVVRNMGQRFTNLATLPLDAQLRALKDYPPLVNRWIKSARQLRESVERTGAIRNRTALGDYETGAPGEALTTFAMRPFTAAETGNQITAALTARYALEGDMKRLMKMQGEQGRLRRVVEALTNGALKPREAIERRVKRLGMTDDEIAEAIKNGGELTTEQIERAMHRMVQDSQFALTFSTERVWWGTRPWARLMAKFKPFAVEQTSLIYNQVVKEAAKGNVAPLAKFTAATLLVGEVYNVARDLLTGREESLTMGLASDDSEDKEIGARLMNDLIDGGGLGMIADLTWGLGGWLVGPAGSSIENLTTLAVNIARRPSQLPLAVRQFIENEVSVTRQVTPLVHRYLREDNDANRFFEHRKWRDRAFKFRRDKEAPTLGAKAVEATVDFFEGRQQSFPATDRTLSYQYAARAVTAGDTDAAAEYLARVLRGLDRREFADVVTGIRQSAASQAPLGPVSQEDMGTFLRQFKPDERSEARRLHAAWLRDYNRALRKAIREAR